MSHADYVATALWIVALAAALWAVCAFGFLPQFRAEFRHQLFALRRELLLLGARGRVSFDDPEYNDVRSTMNGLLRMADKLTGLEVGIFGLLYRNRLVAAVRQSKSAHAEVEAIRKKLLGVTAEYIMQLLPFSPGLWVVFIVRTVIRARSDGERTARKLAYFVDVHARDSERAREPGLVARAA